MAGLLSLWRIPHFHSQFYDLNWVLFFKKIVLLQHLKHAGFMEKQNKQTNFTRNCIARHDIKHPHNINHMRKDNSFLFLNIKNTVMHSYSTHIKQMKTQVFYL